MSHDCIRSRSHECVVLAHRELVRKLASQRTEAPQTSESADDDEDTSGEKVRVDARAGEAVTREN